MSSGSPRREPLLRGRPFVGILFRCCRVYARLYLQTDGSAYAGKCPKCGRPLSLKVTPDGSSSRFFEAG